jgi:transglutaminase-like putative cysteine protease
MKLHIAYHTEYTYEQEVSFSPHFFRLFPRADYFLSVEKVSFRTNATAGVQYRRDIFDNEIARCFYPGKNLVLEAALDLDLDIRGRNAFDFLLERYAVDFPFQYKEEDRAVLAPFLAGAKATLPFWTPPSTPCSTVTAMVELNEAIFANIKYERRDEGAARPGAETIALGCGSCRDFAVLMADVLRGYGVAVRLASGYLCEFGEGEKRAEGALHAWVEAYLPGAGWLGMDPTNGILCNHNHITAAVGLTPGDITPVDGIYYGNTHVPSVMTAGLEMTQCPQ